MCMQKQSTLAQIQIILKMIVHCTFFLFALERQRVTSKKFKVISTVTKISSEIHRTIVTKDNESTYAMHQLYK